MRNCAAWLLLAPAGLLSAGMFLAPFAMVMVTGFWSQQPGSWIVDDAFTLTNYRRLLDDPYFATILVRSFRVSASATLLCLAAGFPVARWIAGTTGQVRGLLIVLTLLPVVCGPLVQTLGMVNLLGSTGLLNGTLRGLGVIESPIHLLGTEAGVVIGLVQAFLPLMVLPLITVFGRIPAELEAAAATLGAPRWRVLSRIVVPLAMPGIAAGAVLVFAASLTSFVTPQILGQGHVQMFGTMVYQQAALVLNWPFASALSVLMLLCLGAAAVIAAALGRLVVARA